MVTVVVAVGAGAVVDAVGIAEPVISDQSLLL